MVALRRRPTKIDGIAPGITTRVTGAGSYTVPKVDVLLSATFQSSPGSSLSANWQITAAGAPAWVSDGAGEHGS